MAEAQVCTKGEADVNEETHCEEESKDNSSNQNFKHVKPKRKHSDSSDPIEPKVQKLEFSSLVADHYNKLEDVGLQSRQESKILYLRNFNNWIKSVLINKYLDLLGEITNVLDLCCGKGGDLLKWRAGRVKHLICVDIAEKSMEQCESRYNSMQENSHNIFSCEFLTADCTRVNIWEKMKDPNISLDLVSCQFSFHYCFESLPQAECMLRNASKCLRVGGYFIGTMPNANEIVKRIRKSGAKSFKNNVCSVEMLSEEPYPLFGAKYNFSLDSVVQCPEFLVHFPTFVKLASKFGLELVYRENFDVFSDKNYSNFKNKMLLRKMCALENYSARNNTAKPCDEYAHIEKYLKDTRCYDNIRTISKSEWEAITIYQVFAFKKIAIDNGDDSSK